MWSIKPHQVIKAMSQERPSPEKVNYRQVGRQTLDLSLAKKTRGATHSAPGAAIPSIPSKYSTVFVSNAQERDAFSSRTHRFQASVLTDIPGPGAYGGLSDFEPKSDSFSKRGFGNLASQTDRFQVRLPPAFPGPGSYDTPVAVPSPPHTAPQSSAFSQPIATGHIPRPVLPGPGQYEVCVAMVSTSLWMRGAEGRPMVGRMLSLFLSIRSIHPISCCAAPGETNDWCRSPGAVPRLPDAHFPPNPAPSPIKRRGKAQTRSRATPRAPPQVRSAFVSKTERCNFITIGDAPGPGTYSTDAPQENAFYQTKPSHFFAPTETSRFGQTPKKIPAPEAPGPGTYNPGGPPAPPPPSGVPTTTGNGMLIERYPRLHAEADKAQALARLSAQAQMRLNPTMRLPASNAVFLSETRRGHLPSDEKPGPAFYKPVGPTHKSFHLNIDRKWL
ncbi:hypothetical protein PAPYR_3973 [Paratrimastix pyriformis]|uniref:Uncharacterized protein n=1 Tax=Paratrimastix pyriformis TaxID=342808 RepID=A0ABQ8UL37_9EUKA|nr:hypothetical protein PAPYR_3973 [Paratrimastix pyriformis]